MRKVRCVILLSCLFITGCNVPDSFKHDNSHDPLSSSYKPYPANNFKASLLSNNAIRLQWKASNINTVKFKLLRKIKPYSQQYEQLAVIPYSDGSYSYVDSLKLKRGDQVQYQIQVFKGAFKSDSAISNIISYNPKLPKDLKYQVLTKTSVRFSWQSNNDFPATYWVACRDSTDGTFSTIKRDYAGTSIVFSDLDTTKTYAFMVSIDDSSSVNNNAGLTVSYNKSFSKPRIITRIGDSNTIKNIAFLNNDKSIAVLYLNGTVKIYNEATGVLEHSINLGPVDSYFKYYGYNMVSNKKGSILVASLSDMRVIVMNNQGDIIRTFKSGSKVQTVFPASIAVTATGDTLIYENSADSSLDLVNTTTGDLLDSIPASFNYYRGLCISNNDKYLAFTNLDSISVWQLSPLRKISNSYRMQAYGLRFSPDNSQLYVSEINDAYNHRELYVFNFDPFNGLTNPLQVIPSHLSYPSSMATMTGDKYVAVSSVDRPKLYLLDNDTKKLMDTYNSSIYANKIVYSRDGDKLIGNFGEGILDQNFDGEQILEFKIEDNWHTVSH